jgi:hypothetical protein
MRFCALVAVVMVLVLPGNRGLADEQAVRKFFKTHCVECHGTETKEAGLRLDALAADFTVPASFGVWVKIHDRLRAGEMPPKDSPQPPSDERCAAVEWLRTQLAEADAMRRRDAGRTVLRRLNRTEYENTLRDLLDLPGIPLRDVLPEDGRAHGYDKSGDGLELSHVQIAKYMEAADLALDVATATQIEAPEVLKERIYPTDRGGFRAPLGNGEAVLLKDFKLDETIFPIPGKQKSPKEKQLERKNAKKDLEEFQGSIGVFRSEGLDFHPKFHDFTAPYAGMYRLRTCFWSFTWDKGEILPASRMHAVSLRAGPRAYERIVAYFDVPSLRPTENEVVVWLNPGDQIGFDAATLRAGNPTGPKGRAEWVGQGVAVDWLEVEGPFMDRWPMRSHRRLYGDLPLDYMGKDSPLRAPDHSQALGKARGPNKPKVSKKLGPWTVVSTQPKDDARRLLGEFLPQAFRRPVSSEEVARYVAIVEQLLTEDLTFEDSMRWAYKTALCSPEFLFLAEPPGKPNDWALASRLSYFLWNSMPDAPLMSLAERSKLHEPAVLRAQVERMLADAKAQRFVNDFVDQWLDLQDIDMTSPDKKLYPEFNGYLRDSMLGETRAFFRELLDRNLSALTFVDSDFGMLNSRLAEHYGIAGVEGTKFRSVALPPDCHRGGVMTQASVLKVTANGTTTTPVKRGAWVLRKMIGQPPAPPPPNIPAIEPDVSGATTIRELLAKHRSSQVCASCHAKMAPPGFALESYDVIGGWRTRYRSLGEGEPTKSADGRNVPYLLGPHVDPAGELKDGQKFADIDGLQRLLLADSDQIARNVIEQLLMYGTGSEIGFADRQVVDDILSRTRPQQHGLRSILHEVVQSRLFREK